jgi:1-deoxy-D-xylulose-5-phosphate reductoisomerase
MEIPIQLALTYPNRIPSGVAQLDLPKLSALHFHPVPEEKFPCFTLAKQALKAGGVMPCVYSAANEAAVEAFLAERIAFCEISDYIALALEKIPNTTPNDYDILSQTALTATAIVRSAIGDKLCP